MCPNISLIDLPEQELTRNPCFFLLNLNIFNCVFFLQNYLHISPQEIVEETLELNNEIFHIMSLMTNFKGTAVN